ncbi:mannose-6-phosphate receptor binding domain-containing protein [Amylocystis lapponica]|nr:mannose-6-phosphate receptor binding domain-containing protein [Amylocystis lapponica]
MLLSILLLGTVSLVLADEKPCTARDGDNFYDLNRLSSSKDYEFTSPSGDAFVVNVCKPVSSDTWAIKVDRPQDVAGFTRRPRGDFSLGYTNTTVHVRDGQPMLIMTGGSLCPLANETAASTVIRFICDTSVFGTGQPYLVAQLPPDESACAFFIEWRTHVACPTNEKGTAWGFLSILAAMYVVSALFMLYILVGTVYNRYVLELRGADQFPRYSLFTLTDAIEFFRNLTDRIRHRPSHSGFGDGGWGTRHRGRTSGGYHGLAEEQEAMMGGPPGFLDEQDEENAHHSPPTPPATSNGGTPPSSGADANGAIRL